MAFSIRIRWPLAILFLTLFCEPLSARVWTDNEGREIKAVYIRVKGQKVVLKKGKQIIKVSFANLSVKDRRYVARELDKRGQGDKLPPTGKLRTWTDAKGKTVEAQFVRFLDNKVILWKDGKTFKIDFEKFSPVDRKYVRDGMAISGTDDKLPEAQPDELELNKPKPEPKATPKPVAKATPKPAAKPSTYKSRSVAAMKAKKAKKNASRSTAASNTKKNSRTASLYPNYKLECLNCGREAPSGAQLGSLCPYCQAEGKKKQEKYRKERAAEMARYKKNLYDFKSPTESKPKSNTAYETGKWAGIGTLIMLVVAGIRRFVSG